MSRTSLPAVTGKARSSTLLRLVALCMTLAACASPGGAPPSLVTSSAAFDHGHTLLDRVLRQHVTHGLVDYRALQAAPQTLDGYLATLASVDPARYATWTRDQQLAFYINAYNAYTLKAIIERYPISPDPDNDAGGAYPPNSIRQIPGVWDRLQWPLHGTYLTLDQMEHTVLRKELAEPRIHFVLVCASLGCPLLENRALTATGLDARLDQVARDYIYRDRKVQIDRANRVVRLPQILRWFAEDFRSSGPVAAQIGKRHGGDLPGVLSWIHRYANDRDRAFLAQGDYRVTYLFYDWGLNEQR